MSSEEQETPSTPGSPKPPSTTAPSLRPSGDRVIETERYGTLTVRYVEVEQGSDAWKDLRRKFLTASNFAAVLGLSPFAKSWDVILGMLDKAPPFPKRAIRAMAWGTKHEDPAAEIYADWHGVELARSGFYYCPELRIGASLDRVVLDDDGIPVRNVEIKCPASWRIPESPPETYLLQVAMQNFLSGVSASDLFYFTKKGIRVFAVPVLSPDEFLDEYKEDIDAFMEMFDRAKD